MKSSPWDLEEMVDSLKPWEEFHCLHPERSQREYLARKKTDMPIVFRDRKQPRTIEEEELWHDKLIALAEEEVRFDPEQTALTVELDSDKPVAIAFTGDWHCGHKGTDHRALKIHNELLASTPGVYCVGMGDYAQNSKANSKPGAALYDSAFPNPDEQYHFAIHEMERLRGKWLGLITGCHDHWNFTAAGLRTMRDICAQLDTANLWHGAVITVKVGEQTYQIGAKHRYGNESNANTTNAQRWFDSDYPTEANLDVICLAHLHYCDLQKRPRKGVNKVWMRSGAYLVWEDYGQRLGGYRGQPGVPIVILYPDRKQVLPFHGTDLKEALYTLRMLRA